MRALLIPLVVSFGAPALASLVGVDATPSAWAAPKKPAKQRPAPREKAPKGGAPRPGSPAAGAPRAPRSAAAAPAAPAREARVELEVVRERLAGGVEVVVAPAPAAPVLAVAVIEGGGWSSDPQGRGGLASLLAHVGGSAATPERRAALLAARGGQASVHVGPDDVVSTLVVPPGELELALWLEADRLTAPIDEDALVDGLRALAAHRAADPFARHHDKLDGLAFQGWAPYAHAPDGTPEELLAIRADARAGAPSRRAARPVVVAIAGPVDPGAAIELARRHLGGISSAPASVPGGELPDQINQRAAAIVDGRARTAAVILGFAVPSAAVAADGPALELAAAVLAGGERSRIARALVDEGSASTARAWLDRRRGPSTWRVEVHVAPGGDVVTVRERVERMLVDLGKGAPRPEELERARAWLALEESDALSHLDQVAVRLGRAAAAGAAAPLGRWDLARWRDVSGDAVARAVTAHLSPIRRNVVEIHPQQPLEAPAPPPREAAPAASSRTAAAPAPAGKPAAPRPAKGKSGAKKKGGAP